MMLAWLLACTVGSKEAANGPDDSGSAVDSTDSGGTGEAPDPLSIAAGVSEDEIRATIEDLAAFGTRYTETDGDDAARDYLVDRLEALGLDVERDPLTAGREPAENVIGWQDGTVDPAFVYVFQAHYDSTSNDPMNLAPGADDNASGVAAVLEAARLLSSRDLTYSAMYVFTAAEEQGSLGSEHLAETLAAAGTDVRGVLAPDMMAYWPLGDEDAFDILGDDGSAALVEQMSDIADQLGVSHKVWVTHDYCYGDDHTMWQEAGLPAISPMDCVEAHNVPGSDEDTPHYHKTTDTVDTLHLPFTARVVEVTTATMATWTVPLD